MSEITELVSEFDAKMRERWPGLLVAKPAATLSEIKVAEGILGAPLTDELVDFYRLHNGCDGYPQRHRQEGLPASNDDYLGLLGQPGFAGSFNVRHALTVIVGSGDQMLQMPLIGEHRGQIYRDCVSAVEYNCRAALSLTEMFQSWLHYLENDYFERLAREPGVLTIAGSNHIESDGRQVFEVLMDAWPEANPLTLDSLSSVQQFGDFLRQRQEESGMDPRISVSHPEHGQLWSYAVEETDRIGNELRS